jgi:hypothetical protein
MTAEGNSAREAVLQMWGIIQLGKALRVTKAFDKWRSVLMYASNYPARRKRTSMDVDKLIGVWLPIVKGIATSHDKKDLDAAEFAMDEALTPILAAPVKQIREFYTKLCAALKDDPAVPFFVWATFSAWGEVILKGAPDGEVVRLKKDIAGRIADLVEEDVRPDIQSAIVGALQWRSQGELEKVEAAVKAGAKPRLRGRESCLFLVVGDGPDAPTVML